ncbi:hypothetical protein DL96DRAFT_1635629 [Flagelloscypha sp. PMI_526]|nr:hypothetical protein DL96DRAFT_1635629 [Flagelloscypha sp. PMI_526]
MLVISLGISRSLGRRSIGVLPYSGNFYAKIGSPNAFTRVHSLCRSTPQASIHSFPPAAAMPLASSQIGEKLSDPSILKAIIQAIQDLPLMQKEIVQRYAENYYAESKGLSCSGDQWKAIVPWLKGCLSGVVYQEDVGQVQEYAFDHVNSPTLHAAYDILSSMLSQLRAHDNNDTEVGHNMNIIGEFLQLSVRQANGFAHSHPKLQYKDWFKDSISDEIPVDESDIAAIESLYSQFKAYPILDDGDNTTTELIKSLALGELRKASILLLTGPNGQHLAARNFVSAHRFIAALDDVDHRLLLHVFQKQLPPPVFERVLRLMAAMNRKYCVELDFRDSLIQAMREMPILTPTTFQEYSNQCLKDVKELVAQGKGDEAPVVVPWLKAYISVALQSKVDNLNENLADAKDVVRTPLLQDVEVKVRKLINKMNDKAPGDPLYSLGIMNQQRELYLQATAGQNHDDLIASYKETSATFTFEYIDPAKTDEMTALDLPIFVKLFAELPQVISSISDTEEPWKAIVTLKIALADVEIQKACILLSAGGACVPRSTPYFVDTYILLAHVFQSHSQGLIQVMLAYHHMLPRPVLERINQFLWLFLHTEDPDCWTSNLPFPSPPHREIIDDPVED